MLPTIDFENPITARLVLLKSVTILILLVYEWIIVKGEGKWRMAWNFALLLVVLPWMVRNTPVENTLLYLPSGLIAVSLFWERWREKAYNIGLLLPMILFILAWIFSGILVPVISIVLSGIIINVVQPLIIMLFIYWSRWWVISSEKFQSSIA